MFWNKKARPMPRVMIIDHQERDAALFRDALKPVRVAVDLFKEVSPAMAALASANTYALVIVEFQMPKGAALRLSQSILEKYKVPVFFYSQMVLPHMVRKAIEAGVTTFLDKQMKYEDIAEEVSKKLANSKNRNPYFYSSRSLMHSQLNEFDSVLEALKS